MPRRHLASVFVGLWQMETASHRHKASTGERALPPPPPTSPRRLGGPFGPRELQDFRARRWGIVGHFAPEASDGVREVGFWAVARRPAAIFVFSSGGLLGTHGGLQGKKITSDRRTRQVAKLPLSPQTETGPHSSQA